MRWDMNSFSFPFFDCSILNSITIVRRSRRRICWRRWFLFLLFARKWIRLLLWFLLFCDRNASGVRHRQTFAFLDYIQFLLVGRTKCERFVHVEFDSFSTELTWLLQHGCLLVQVHNRLARLFAKVLLQCTVLTSDHIPIVLYLKLQKQRSELLLVSFGDKLSMISYDWFNAGECADRCFLVTTFMNEELFHNARRALYLCTQTFSLQNYALRCHQNGFRLEVLRYLITNTDLSLFREKFVWMCLLVSRMGWVWCFISIENSRAYH